MPLTPNNREEAWLKGMVDGSTTLTPNNRREHWYQEIVNAGGGGGGGGGGVLVVIADQPMANPPSWVAEAFEGYTVYETNVTYDQLHEAFGSNVIGLSVPAIESIYNPMRQQVIVELGDLGYIDDGGYYFIAGQIFKFNGNLVTFEISLVANAENGALYFAMENYA